MVEGAPNIGRDAVGNLSAVGHRPGRRRGPGPDPDDAPRCLRGGGRDRKVERADCRTIPLKVTAITLRRDPIYLSTFTGRPPDEPSVLGEALNEVFIPLLRRQFPESMDFWLPPEGCSYRIAVVSMTKPYPGPRQARDDGRVVVPAAVHVHEVGDRRGRRHRLPELEGRDVGAAWAAGVGAADLEVRGEERRQWRLAGSGALGIFLLPSSPLHLRHPAPFPLYGSLLETWLINDPGDQTMDVGTTRALGRPEPR